MEVVFREMDSNKFIGTGTGLIFITFGLGRTDSKPVFQSNLPQIP